MPTKKDRINISLRKDLKEALAKVARRDRVPQATAAAHLLEAALELEEDQAWDALAAERDQEKGRFVSHQKAWE